MRILLLSYEYPPETGFGGIGTYTWYQARALAKLGHTVHVLAGATDPTPLRAAEHDGVTVFRYRIGGALPRAMWTTLGALRLWWTRIRIDTAFSMYRGLIQLQRSYRYDIVEMPECGAEGMLVNSLTWAQTVVRLHSPARLIMPYYDAQRSDFVLCSAAEWRGMAAATAISSCSRFLADAAHVELGLKRATRVIPNGIDLDLFDAADDSDFRSTHGIPTGVPIIFFAGRMERRKGVHLCRTIAASILERHESAFVMAGQDLFGIMQNDIAPYLAERRLKGTFHYIGKLDLAQVRSGVRQCDIFLLPSLWENCPYSCLEAMAAGRAIVSTDQGGMPELITDGMNGLLATNGDSASYVAALDRLLCDDELRHRLGRAARRTVQREFTDLNTARRSVEYYRDVIAGDRLQRTRPGEPASRPMMQASQ